MTNIICLGAGGHAASILSVFKRQYRNGKAIILDPDPALKGKHILGFEVVGSDDLVNDYISQGYSHFVIGVGMIKPSPIRSDLFHKMIKLGLKPLSLIDPTACIVDNVEIQDGSVVLMGAIINTDVKIGRNVIVNSGAIIEHHSVIHDHVHVAPGVILCGDVEIGNHSFIGAGSVIIQGSRVPPSSLIISQDNKTLTKNL